ncbi:hypothetical protein LZ554_009465 [Drepanopeziza brunnea f. sp. 'monogermtubi']|nr:hypothetical protein LZ554_009465 [Drepanopeziza brunnea f. sp. 'monogermtubi']
MAETIHQLPEWETPAPPKQKGLLSKWMAQSPLLARKQEAVEAKEAAPGGEDSTAVKPTFSDRFVPHWAACSIRPRSRKSLLYSLGALLLLLALALGIGLGIGLPQKSNKAKNLPLPTGNGTFNGDLTYYDPGLGACGLEHAASDSICAVSHSVWDAAMTGSNPNDNPLCGREIRVTRYNEAVRANRSVDVTVVDKCMGCEPTDLDLSIKMFTTLADESLGRVVGTWAWLN